MLIDVIAGARPNFVKISSIIDAIKNDASKKLNYRLIHTGQHYDSTMSTAFFEELNIPQPDFNLQVGSGSHAEQTAKIMIRYEGILQKHIPHLCLVVGDVNSTLACTIVAKKMGILVAHVEAGLRSHDISMPEEVNRIVTDSIADYFFTTSQSASKNLINAGARKERIFMVGNTMADTLLKNKPRFRKPTIWNDLNLLKGQYLILTLHRPKNVDKKQNLKELINCISKNTRGYPIIFPVHPRTNKILNKITIDTRHIHLTKPMGYLEFNYLVERALAVITDSGGITEETTLLGIPCMTLRDNTERPETITIGTNELLGTKVNAIPKALEKLFKQNWKKGRIPKYWDGKTGSRIVKQLLSIDI